MDLQQPIQNDPIKLLSFVAPKELLTVLLQNFSLADLDEITPEVEAQFNVEGMRQTLLNARRALDLIDQAKNERTQINPENWKEISRIVRPLLVNQTQELLVLIVLDDQHRLANASLIAAGDFNSVKPNMRRIIETTLAARGSNIYMFHNHPGSDMPPSPADVTLFDNHKAYLNEIDIVLRDSIIVAKDANYSIATAGKVYSEYGRMPDNIKTLAGHIIKDAEEQTK